MRHFTPINYTKNSALKLITLVFLIILYLPIINLIVFSFNDSKRNIVWRGFTSKYYEKLFENEMLFVGERDFRVEGEFLVADVVIPHIPMNAGMKIWGWVDMPSTSYEFSTCDPTVGDQVNYYAERYSLGTNAIDVLNYPGKYIDFGDWVVQTPAEITDPNVDFELVVDFHYVEEE